MTTTTPPPDLLGKYACTRCGHDQYAHNLIVGCPHCKCAATPGEAGDETHFPGTDRPYTGRILRAEETLHEWQKKERVATFVRIKNLGPSQHAAVYRLDPPVRHPQGGPKVQYVWVSSVDSPHGVEGATETAVFPCADARGTLDKRGLVTAIIDGRDHAAALARLGCERVQAV